MLSMIIHQKNNSNGKTIKAKGGVCSVFNKIGLVSRQHDSLYSLIAGEKENNRADCVMLDGDDDDDVGILDDDDAYDDDEDIQRDSGNSSKCSSSEFSSFNSAKNDKPQTTITSPSEEEAVADESDFIDSNNLSSSSTTSSCEKRIEIDLTLVDHDRTLNSLLNLEDYYRLGSNYFIYTQNEVKPWMRKMLAGWMLEVCKNQGKEEDVFALAMNILDRFLSVQQIGKRHLQLLGTVCMFLASKLRSSSQFNTETLVIYTANSITIDELLNWEQFVLQKLRWDISAITPFDYIPYLFNKLDLTRNPNVDTIRSTMYSFISMCAQEYKFSMLPASMIASGCLFLALKYLNNVSKAESEQLLTQIHLIINEFVDLDCLVQCVEQIDELVQSELKQQNKQPCSETTTTTTTTISMTCGTIKPLADTTNIVNSTATTMMSKAVHTNCYESTSVEMKENHRLVNIRV